MVGVLRMTSAPPFTYKTIADVRAANKANGYCWFSRDTMRFFNTRIESKLIAGRYFITSEQMFYHTERRYTVREAMPDGSIETVGEFYKWRSKDEAKRAIQRMI